MLILTAFFDIFPKVQRKHGLHPIRARTDIVGVPPVAVSRRPLLVQHESLLLALGQTLVAEVGAAADTPLLAAPAVRLETSEHDAELVVTVTVLVT